MRESTVFVRNLLAMQFHYAHARGDDGEAARRVYDGTGDRPVLRSLSRSGERQRAEQHEQRACVNAKSMTWHKSFVMAIPPPVA